jgi:hypothetical protein
MTHTIIIGDKPLTQHTRPLSLPARLDLEACLKVLERIDPEAKTESVAAARASVDVAKIDVALEYHDLSLDDRFRIKAAFREHGIIPRGRPVSMSRV